MSIINEIFRTYGSAYLHLHGATLPFAHNKAIEAIMNCRSGDSGSVIYPCEDCREIHSVPRRCGNRHCPGGQHHKTQQWVQRPIDRQLPGHHFMLTFTVPEPRRDVSYHHQPVAYNALFNASAEAIKALARDPKQLGAERPGFFGVLPTWGRQLPYHPHGHYGVPGGAFSSDDHPWHPPSPGCFRPVKALSKMYRAQVRGLMVQAGLLQKIPAAVWETDWNGNGQAVGASEDAVKYLAPYVFKVATTDSRIVNVENDQVTCRYRQPHSNRERTLTRHALEIHPPLPPACSAQRLDEGPLITASCIPAAPSPWRRSRPASR